MLRRLLMDKNAECDNLREAVAALTSALGEMNEELRAKTSECDALQGTVATLSSSLQESDQQLNELSLHCEQLELKLQAVTFIDKKEDAENRKGKKKKPKNNRRKRPIQFKDDDDEDLPDDELEDDLVNSFMSSDDTGSILKPISISSSSSNEYPGVDQNQPSTASTPSTSSPQKTPQNPPPPAPAMPQTQQQPNLGSAPCQAAFYRVISERDAARREAEKLAREVRARREQVRKLKARLNKSTALIELSYGDDVDDRNDSHTSPMKWLKKPKGMKLVHKELATVSKKLLTPKLLPSSSSSDHEGDESTLSKVDSSKLIHL